MTTNYKERLDPALLRPGRVDEIFEITFASKLQVEKLCYRFYKNKRLAEDFAEKIPENKFAMSMLQGFFLKYRKNPESILEKLSDLLQSDENVKIDQFLNEINCEECTNEFKMEECYTLASAKNLPKTDLDRITSKLNPILKGRLLETIRQDRSLYIKSLESIEKYVHESVDEEIGHEVMNFVRETKATTFFQVRDKIKELTEKKQ